jgi:hypothetical protein
MTSLIRLCVVLGAIGVASAGLAQTPQSRDPGRSIAPSLPVGQGALFLSATLGASSQAVRSGLRWRVVAERAEADGQHALVAESQEATPLLRLPDGDYIVHAAWGLASAMKRVSVNGKVVNERLSLNAGALKISSVLGDSPLPPNRLSITVNAPDRQGAEGRVIVQDAKPGEIIRLPEGSYRVVSTYLEKEQAGSTPAPGAAPNATNSVVNAELRVQAGRITEATLRHRAANMTLKLVNAPGGEALANTSFTVLTPGGDVIREMVGAFPSLVVAEGEYVVIARRAGKTWQATFTVQSALDRDVEVIAK